VTRAPWLDLSSGYVQRSLHLFPQQGSRPPWRLHQNYLRDLRVLGSKDLEGEGITFQRATTAQLAAARDTEPAL
jgi:hypothetical protein